LGRQGRCGYPGRSAPHEYFRAAIRISGISLFVILQSHRRYSRVQQLPHDFRGPFCNASDWLSSPTKTEIFALSSTPSPSPQHIGELRPLDSSLTLNIMSYAVRLCSKYPGHHSVISNTTVSREPFSFMFDDFSLSNIMIDNTVTGYIYSEVATIVPLWKCITVPEWSQVTDYNDG